MNKPPAKLPLNRRKPVGSSFSASDVERMVRSAGERAVETQPSPLVSGLPAGGPTPPLRRKPPSKP